MNKNFILSGIAATIVNLLIVAGLHFLFLKNIMEAHPPVSAEFHKQLIRPPDQLIGWAMAATSLTMGFFIATVIKWSGARTFVSGLKKGFIVGFLFWSSVNFGLCKEVSVRRKLQTLLKLGDKQPMLLIRMGYSEPMPYFFRRPLRDVIISN